MPGTNAPLSPRQEISFNHLCDLYSPARSYATDGKPTPERWGPDPAYVNVRCRFEISINLSEIAALGRIQVGGVLTLDRWHCSEDQTVDDNWLAYNHSLRPDGSISNMFGFFWTLRSISRFFVQSDTRDGGKQVFEASIWTAGPLGLTILPYP